MDYAFYLSREMNKLDTIEVSNDAKNAIKDFINDLTFEGISDGRKYAYVIRLRRIAVMAVFSIFRVQ